MKKANLWTTEELETELKDRRAEAAMLRRPRLIRYAVGLVCAAAIAGAAFAFMRLGGLPVARDVLFAVYAHHMAGKPVPFNPDYGRGYILDPAKAWGVSTNSQWLLDKTSLIVPYFASEGVSTRPIYPRQIYFVPYVAQRSFVVAGSAQCDDPEATLVVLNERVVMDNRWNDEADALHTLVHELVHVQGGVFCTGTSESLESATEAAAMEVMAAMCNWGDKLACQAFWGGIESFARRSLWVQAHSAHADWLFALWSNVYLRDADEERGARKTDRFWAPSTAERYTISYKYGFLPWRDIFLAGVWSPRQGLYTGHHILSERYAPEPLIMPFDDSADLLGLLRLLAWIR